MAGYQRTIGATDYSASFPIIYAAQRMYIGDLAIGDAISDDWSTIYTRNAAPAAEELTLNTPPNLTASPGDTYAVIVFDRNSGGMLTSDIYIRGVRIRQREDGETDADWVEIEDGDGGSYTPYYLFNLTNGTTYNIEVALAYRYPPTYALVYGDPEIVNVMPESAPENVVAQYRITAGAATYGSNDPVLGYVDSSETTLFDSLSPTGDVGSIAVLNAHSNPDFAIASIANDEVANTWAFFLELASANIDLGNTANAFQSIEIEGIDDAFVRFARFLYAIHIRQQK